MKSAIALAFALALTGCATDGYYSGYGGYGYDGYSPYTYYNYSPYSYPYYGYPSLGANIFYYDRDFDRDHRHHQRDRDWRARDDRRDWRGRDDGHDRGDRGDRGQRRPDRAPLDTRHGEAGNEAGM